MKYSLLILMAFSAISYANDDISDFDAVVDEAVSTESLKDMAEREEVITRAAKAKHERTKMGLDYEEGTGWIHVAPIQSNTVQSDASSEPKAFRIKSQRSVKVMPVVKGIFSKSVRLEYNGTTKTYRNGDQVGPFNVDKIDLSVVILRSADGKRHELSTDW